jgi:hypothetical protein
LRIAGTCLLLLSFISFARAEPPDAASAAPAADATVADTAAAPAPAESPQPAAATAEASEPVAPVDSAATSETAEPVPAADAAEPAPAEQPVAEQKKSKKRERACEETYVNSRLPQKTCK